MGDRDRDGVGDFFLGDGDGFLCWRGAGVGVATKKSRTFFAKDSSSSSELRPKLVAVIAAATVNETSKNHFPFTRPFLSSQFFQDSLVHSNAGVEILERKIFVR